MIEAFQTIYNYIETNVARDPDERKQFRKNPKDYLKNHLNLSLPDNLIIKVYQDTADTIHIVLPYIIEDNKENNW